MNRHFLGKPIPESKQTLTSPRSRISWVFLLAPLVLLGSFLSLNLQATPPESEPSGQEITLAAIPSRILLDPGSTTTTSTTTPSNPCDYSKIKSKFNPTSIFPLITPNILDGTAGKCSPPYWGRDVFAVLIWKVIGFLNWLAFVVAVIFTIYAGLMYIAGFMNEANVKKAKTILIGTYVGLAIVLSARLILYGTIQALINGPVNPDIINPGGIKGP